MPLATPRPRGCLTLTTMGLRLAALALLALASAAAALHAPARRFARAPALHSDSYLDQLSGAELAWSTAPPALAYAADKPALGALSDASFVGQYELEEREDADSAKTLMELTADGKALLGSTDGIPFADSKGRWEYDGKELILELTRTFEDVKSTFSTTRVFIGDVIALNDVPPQVQGAIKMTPSPTSDDMLRIPRHTLPTDAVGYFVAVKIPEIPGAV